MRLNGLCKVTQREAELGEEDRILLIRGILDNAQMYRFILEKKKCQYSPRDVFHGSSVSFEVANIIFQLVGLNCVLARAL